MYAFWKIQRHAYAKAFLLLWLKCSNGIASTALSNLGFTSIQVYLVKIWPFVSKYYLSWPISLQPGAIDISKELEAVCLLCRKVKCFVSPFDHWRNSNRWLRIPTVVHVISTVKSWHRHFLVIYKNGQSGAAESDCSKRSFCLLSWSHDPGISWKRDGVLC